MTFEEIPIRMLQLGVDRPWLCQECRYSKSTLANILAPNGSNRNDRALETIWEALDREEERQKSAVMLPAPLGHRVFIEPTEEQFDHWMEAVYHQPGRTFDQWARTGLDGLAAEELGRILPAAGNAPLQSLPAPAVHKKNNG